MGHTFPLKRLSCALSLLAFCAVSHAQTAFQTCAFSDPTHCYGIGPGNTGQAYMSNGAAAYPSFSSSLPGVTSVNGTTIPANGTLLSIPSLVNGYVLSNNGTSLQWILNASTPGGSNLQLQYNNSGAFGGIALGTSGEALISNGSSSAPSFSTSLSGVTSVNGSTISASAGTIPGSTGSFTASDCLKVGSTSPLEIADTGAACGSGGSTAFSALTGGTNTTAAMVVGTGASLNFTASGTINASTLNGATFASPGDIGGITAGGAIFTTLQSQSSYQANGEVVFNGAPSSSTPVTDWTAAPYSAGTGNTNFPLAYQETAGATAPSTWSLGGTYFGVNSLSGFSGNFLDFHVNGGASVASLSYTGSLTVSNLVDSALTAGTSPVCPNGSGGALTTTGCTTGSSPAFSVLTSGTNTSAAMLVGTGSSLGVTGSGTITASGLSGSPTSGQYWGYNGTAQGWYTPTGSGTVNSGTSGYLAYYAATGTAVSGEQYVSAAQFPALTGDVTNTAGSLATTVGKVNGGSIPTSANCVSTNSASQFTTGCAEAVNAQTGTTYTVASTDCGKQITLNNASAVAVSLPQATSSFATCQIDFTDLGAGTATVTPTTSTINGSSSLAIAQNRQCTVNSDGTNWQVIGCTALVSSGTMVYPGAGIANSTGTAWGTSYSSTNPIPVADGGSGTSTPALVAGTNITITGSWPNQTITASSTASTAFSAITGSTNTTAAMVVGSGASLATTGTGTIQATNYLPQVNTATSGTSVTPDCTYPEVQVTVSTGTAFTINAPGTCTPVNGQRLRLEVTASSSGAPTYTWTTGAAGDYIGSTTVTLPTTGGGASELDAFEFEYNSGLSRWMLLAYSLGY